MQQDLLRIFTDLGDPTLLLLGGFGVFFYLWTDDDQRLLARHWALAFGLCIFLTVASKFALYFIGHGQRNAFALQSPSGHVAIATGFYGCCARLLAAGRSLALRALICIGTTLLLGSLAASRIMLGLHTISEITFGFAIGALCIAVFQTRLSHARPIVLNASHVMALLFLIGVAHYSHVDGEPMIRRLAERASTVGPQLGLQLNGVAYREGPSLETSSATNVDSAKR